MLMTPTTDASSAVVKLKFGGSITVRGDLGSKEIAIEVHGEAPNVWSPLIEDGKPVVLSATQMSLAARGSLYIRVNKPATDGPVGVEVG